MAVHTWVDGEAITASKLNRLEKRKAYVEKTLDLATCTAREVLEMVEDMPGLWIYRDQLQVPIYVFQISYPSHYDYWEASSLDDYLIKDEGGKK